MSNYRVPSLAEKLKEGNYSRWVVRMSDALAVNDLLDIALGEEEPPQITHIDIKGEMDLSQMSAVSSFKLWKKRDQQALATIRLNIEDSVFVHVERSQSAAAAWKTLQEQLAPTGGSVPFQRITAYYMSRPSQFETLFAYITHIKQAKQNCEELDIIISPLLYKFHLVAYLPESCSILKEILVSSLSTLKEQEVEARIIDYERRQEVDGMESALLAAKGPGVNQGARPKCSRCGKLGHTEDGINGKNRCFKKYPEDVPPHLRRPPRSSASDATTTQEAHVASEWDEEYLYMSAENSINATSSSSYWIADCGASSHYSNNPSFFLSLSSLLHPIPIKLGNGSTVYATHEGPIRLILQHDGRRKSIVLEKAYLVPELHVNLLSLGQASSSGLDTLIQDGTLSLVDRATGKVNLTITKDAKKLFSFKASHLSSSTASSESCHVSSFGYWHRRFGHIAGAYLESMSKRQQVTGMPKNLRQPDNFFCVPCAIGKSKALPHPRNDHRATNPLQLVMADLQGPFPCQSIIGHFLYVLNIYDQATIKRWTIGLRKKSDANEAIKIWHKLVEKISGYKLISFLSDPGGEFMSHSLKQYWEENGVQQLFTNRRSPEQNGGVERGNGTSVNDVLTFLNDSNLPPSLWFEAYSHAVDNRNLTPSQAINLDIPELRFFPDKRLTIKDYRDFGASCYAHVDVRTNKLGPRAKKMRFVGYAKGVPGFRLYDEDKRMVEVHRDVKWMEADLNKEEVPRQEWEETNDGGGEDEVEVEVSDTDGGDEPSSSSGSFTEVPSTAEPLLRASDSSQENQPF